MELELGLREFFDQSADHLVCYTVLLFIFVFYFLQATTVRNTLILSTVQVRGCATVLIKVAGTA